MGGITRYAVIETALCIGSNLMEGEVFMVMATDHDREFAALREELAAIKTDLDKGDWKAEAIQRYSWLKEVSAQRDDLNQRLTAVEQRNAELTNLIEKAHTWVDRNNCGGWDAYELRDQLAAALKPTESGASE